MKIISAPASRDKLSSHRRDFEIISADATLKIFRNRRVARPRWRNETRRRVEVASRYLHRTLQLSANQAVSKSGIPRVRDYKVTDEGTDGRTKGSRSQPGDTLMPRLQWHYNTVHSLLRCIRFIGPGLHSGGSSHDKRGPYSR